MGFRNVFIAALGLTLAACASSPPSRSQQKSGNDHPAPQVHCADCGQVERIEVSQVSGGSNGNGKGAVLSGIVGDVASGATTGYGPVKRTVTPDYRISVRMDDGRHLVFVQGMISPNLREGSPVRIDNGRVVFLR